MLELLDVADDERFTTFQGRSAHRVELEELLAAWIADRDSAEVLAEFRGADAAIAPVLDMRDIFEDPHYRAREIITEVDGVKMQNVVARMSVTPGRIRHAGRALDADRVEIFSELMAQDDVVGR